MAKRRAMQLVLIVLITGSFLAVSQLLYHNITMVWNKAQLEDLAARNIIRAEFATDRAINTIVDIQTRDLTDCSAKSLSAFKNYVASVGSIKDIRLRSGTSNCAVFSAKQLEADLNSMENWETSLNSTVRLGVLGAGDHQSLSILWKGDDHDIVTVLSTHGLLYDMAPSALRPHLTMRVVLNSGKEIAAYQPDNPEKAGVSTAADLVSFTAISKRYPIKAILTINKSALSAWNHNIPLIASLIIGFIGVVIGVLATRALYPPRGVIDEIDAAIENGEFVPYFQPIIDLQSSTISGFEMLARWIRPDGEMVCPGRFIPLAENFGKIDAMLFSLLRTAGMSISGELRQNPALKMTFNVTPAQFLDPTFLPRLLGVVKLVGLPLTSLVAEITERQELADLELASQTIAEYKKHGIQIAIDDAGTGHNGLSSIQKLDVGTLKLDKIFIDGIVDNQRSRQMIELLANLARQYQMTIVAEGIETPEQAAAALSMGISEGQGFYFSRPIPVSDLLTLLDDQRQPLVQNNEPQSRKNSSAPLKFAS